MSTMINCNAGTRRDVQWRNIYASLRNGGFNRIYFERGEEDSYLQDQAVVFPVLQYNRIG